MAVRSLHRTSTSSSGAVRGTGVDRLHGGTPESRCLRVPWQKSRLGTISFGGAVVGLECLGRSLELFEEAAPVIGDGRQPRVIGLLGCVELGEGRLELAEALERLRGEGVAPGGLRAGACPAHGVERLGILARLNPGGGKVQPGIEDTRMADVFPDPGRERCVGFARPPQQGERLAPCEVGGDRSGARGVDLRGGFEVAQGRGQGLLRAGRAAFVERTRPAWASAGPRYGESFGKPASPDSAWRPAAA